MAWFLESWRCQSNRVRDCIKFKKKMMKKQASRRGREFGPPINRKRQCLLVYCCAAAVSLCLALPLMTSDEMGTDMNHIQSVVKYCQSLGSSYALLNGFLCRFRKFPGLILSRFLLYFTILHIISMLVYILFRSLLPLAFPLCRWFSFYFVALQFSTFASASSM